MNRRHFLGQIVLGSAAVASHVRPSIADGGLGGAAAQGGLTVKFVGMMGFVKRSDTSMLVALPGRHRLNHYAHVPFLMARAGSGIAAALKLTPMAGVVAGAFDDQLTNESSAGFVFRCLDGADVEITSGSTPAVANHATQLAQMHLIARGKRLRGNLQRWAQSTVSLKGGALLNAWAHPDAGKVWSFGDHQQPLTDAAKYVAAAATIRVGVGAGVDTFHTGFGENAELWVVSAAGPRTDSSDPKRLEHGGILFEYLSDATPVTAYCAEAEGRITLATELPCAMPSMASTGGSAAPAFPPYVELCYNALFDPDGR